MRIVVLSLIAAVYVLAACKAEEAEPSVALGSASCEAYADNARAQCPELEGHRLFNIQLCEEDRADAELIGCDEVYAQLVLCQTAAAGYDCEQGPVECEDEMTAWAVCRQRFAQTTGCSRIPRDDLCEGQPQPYAFNCLGTPPSPCVGNNRGETEGESILMVGIKCCPPFAASDASYFTDPELGPDELPPDYSDVDFTDRAACVAFQDEQGWGACEETSGCACDSCADELAACAGVHSCLFSRGCTLGLSCSPNTDPLFTGYGVGADLEDALTACMEAAGCTIACP